jgi:multidrug efflux pump subunit AcrA (membrane-fusion protein)
MNRNLGRIRKRLKAQVTGYLLRQDYKEGAFVKKGQLLFQIDPRPFQSALDKDKAQLTQAKAQLVNAEANLIENLWRCHAEQRV